MSVCCLNTFADGIGAADGSTLVDICEHYGHRCEAGHVMPSSAGLEPLVGQVTGERAVGAGERRVKVASRFVLLG